MEWPTRRSLVFLCLLTLSSIAVDAASPAAAEVPVPVRLGVVLDLTSDGGTKRLACISMALDDFGLKHPTYATRVELRVRDSRGDLATAAHAAEDLIKNAQVQALILQPQTLNETDFVAHLGLSNHFPVLSFSVISPASCAFWLEDHVKTSGTHAKFGFTLGSDTITFIYSKAERRNNLNLDTRKSGQNCEGKALKIAVPRKQGFLEFVDVIDPIANKGNFTGYSIDIFEAAIGSLDPSPCYEFIVFDGPYDELIGNVSSGVYDGAVGDVTITAQRVNITDFTVPYTQSGVYMLVLVEDEPDTISWRFVKPLSGWLWLATMLFFPYTGFVVWMIELPRNQEYQGSSLRQCSTALYFVFSTLTFSHGHSIKSPLAKIVVVIWCFVVLILVQSYTASLSSILTAKRLRPQVTDLDQLQRNDEFVGYQNGSFVRSFLMTKHNFSESRLRNCTTKEQYADALSRGSKNGGVSAIVDEIPYLTSFLSDPRYKDDFTMLGCIYKTPGFGFAFRPGSPVVHNLSTAILNLTEGVKGSAIEAQWFGTPSIGVGTVPDTDSAPLTLRSFSGLFLITGSISTLMLLISIVRLVHAKYTGLRNNDVESVSYNNVDEASHSLQDGMGDNPSPHQQPLHETVNDIEDIHVSDENSLGGESGPVQPNVMHHSSVPAAHIQIEMSNV